MTGSNENTTAEIAQELGTVVANNALQASSQIAHFTHEQLSSRDLPEHQSHVFIALHGRMRHGSACCQAE
jgi:hypothetical protein